MSARTDAPDAGPMTDLRPYQVIGVDAVTAGLADGGRGQLYSACGTGKTIVAIRSAERLCPDGGLVVVLCPSLALIAQTLETWQKFCNRPFTALAVASDRTVSDSPSGVEDLPCPVTTDPNFIRSWLQTADTGLRLIVGTHVSADRLGEALLAARMSASLLLVDEAHHTAGNRGKHSSLVHDDRRLPAQRRLYMTATPRLWTSAAGFDSDTGLVSMDAGDVFGPVLSNYPLSRAISEHWLDDYRLAVIGVTRQDVLAVLREVNTEAISDPFAPSIRTAAVQVALAQAAQEWNLRRVITFCPRIADAGDFARTLPRTVAAVPPERRPAGPLHSGLVTGKQSIRQRMIELDQLALPPEGGWTVLSNARVLSEGVDVPAVDGVVFTHPKKSTVDIVQAVGRALRPHPEGRQTATVLVPILLPDDPSELTDVGDAAEYETLWQVVRALRAHDDVLGAELDQRRATSFGGYASGLPEKIIVQLPAGFDDGTWLRHLTVRIVRSATSPWWDGFAAATAFHAEHGHLQVGKDHVTAQGYRLGQWITVQRSLHRKLLLTSERVEALEGLGIVWDPREAQWQTVLEDARAFHTEHGHLAPSTQGADSSLANWLRDRRAERRAGDLSTERADQLHAIDPLWHDVGLTRGLAAARRYYRAHADLQVPARHREGAVDLSLWLSEQRAAYRAEQVHPVVQAALDEMGFAWSSSRDLGSRMLEAARRFHTEHGHLDVPDDDPDDAQLARWLIGQRSGRRRGALNAARIAALDELGFDWAVQIDRRWEAGLAAARAFHARTGSLRVPANHLEGELELAGWLERRRADRRVGRLAADRVVALEALGIEWEPRPGLDRWLAAAQRYYEDNGDLWVVATYVTADGLSLGAWISTQRQLRRAGQLSSEVIDALDELGMIWDALAARTARALGAARAYREQHGDLRVPPGHLTDDGFALGRWIRRQRTDRRAGKVDAETERELDQLGMVWDPGSNR